MSLIPIKTYQSLDKTHNNIYYLIDCVLIYKYQNLEFKLRNDVIHLFKFDRNNYCVLQNHEIMKISDFDFELIKVSINGKHVLSSELIFEYNDLHNLAIFKFHDQSYRISNIQNTINLIKFNADDYVVNMLKNSRKLYNWHNKFFIRIYTQLINCEVMKYRYKPNLFAFMYLNRNVIIMTPTQIIIHKNCLNLHLIGDKIMVVTGPELDSVCTY